MTPRPPRDLKVFISSRESRCDECKQDFGRHAWITLERDGRAVCLACADLDHLVFLPAGDAAVTRRARKRSGLSAVVVKWSRARKRYERQGLLVEEDALKKAEEECAADAATRAARRASPGSRCGFGNLAHLGALAEAMQSGADGTARHPPPGRTVRARPLAGNEAASFQS